MENDTKPQLPNKKIIAIVVVAIAVLLASAIYFTSINHKSGSIGQTETGKKLLDQEKAREGLVKSDLNLFYVSKGEYPVSQEVLVDFIHEKYKDNPESEDITDTLNSLKDFKYTVKGDQSSYKFTYTNLDGKPIAIEGNYKEEYH